MIIKKVEKEGGDFTKLESWLFHTYFISFISLPQMADYFLPSIYMMLLRYCFETRQQVRHGGRVRLSSGTSAHMQYTFQILPASHEENGRMKWVPCISPIG